MKRTRKGFRFVVSLLLVFTLLVPELAPVFAADWNGGSADSNVGNVSGSTGGFAVKSGFAVESGSIPFIALRFSFYNVNTKTTEGTTVDIFRSEYTTEMGWNKFSAKYNKPQLIEMYKSWDWSTFKSKGFTTGQANCYAENDAWLGLTSFPDYTDKIASQEDNTGWVDSDEDVNAVLATIGISDSDGDGSFLDEFGYGDYLLVEPMFPVQLKGTWYVLTLTEMAILGTHADFNGVGSNYDGTGWASSDDGTWRWINNYPNKVWPNSLYIDSPWVDGNGNAVLASTHISSIKTTGYYTFDYIIKNGLGMGIAWTNPTATAEPSYTVNHYVGNTDGTYPSTPTHSQTLKGAAGTKLTLADLTGGASGYKSPYHIYDHGEVGGKTVTTTTIAADGSTKINLYYRLPKYTIKYNGNGATGGSTADSTHYYLGSSALTANGYTRTGYTFVGWKDADGVSYTDKQVVSNLTSKDGDVINLYAQWASSAVSYTVYHFRMDTSGAYPSTPYETETLSVTAGTAVTVADLAKSYTGFTFVGGKKYPTGDYVTSVTITSNGSHVLIYYSRNKYTVTPVAGTGIDSVSGGGEYYYGEDAEISAIVKTGYIFDEWTEIHSYSASTYFIVSSDVTCTASATPIMYTIKYDGNGATGGSTANSKHTYDVAKALTANGYTRTGYNFTGWNTKADGTGTSYADTAFVKNLTSTAGATITLYAQWTTKKFTVTWKNHDGTTLETDTGVEYGTTPTYNGNTPTKTRKGYTCTFAGWTPSVSAVTGNVTYTATFTETALVYTIEYQANGGSGTMNSHSVAYGDKVTISSNQFTRAGYTFAGWSTRSDNVDDGHGWTGWSGTWSYVDGQYGISGQKLILYARWEAASGTQYTVNHYQMDTSGNYPTSPYASETLSGTTGATLTLADLKKTYTGFTYSYGQVGGSTVTTTTILADGSRVINLYYSRNQYTVTLNKGTGISDISGAGTYYYGATVTINATLSNGYDWSSWSGTHSASTQKYAFTMPADNVTDTANATPKTIKLTLNADGGSGHTTVVYYKYGINKFYTDAACTNQITSITRPTKTGHTYDTSKGFFGDGSSGGNNGERYIAYDSVEFASDLCTDIYKDATLTCTWTVNSYTLTVNPNGGSWDSYTTSQTYTLKYGDTMTIPNATKTGSTFSGWSVSGGGSLSGTTYTQGAGDCTLTAAWDSVVYNNVVNHWMWGFQNGEGNNGNKQAYHITDTYFTGAYGSSFTVGTDRATTIPNGFYLVSAFGTPSTGSSWQTHAMGTSITQIAGSMSFEYDYHPTNYTISYNLGGGTNNAANPTSYNVLYGVTLQAPTRTGYTFDGWYIGSTKVTGINAGANATFSSVDDMYNKLASRTTGNITLTAKWVPVDYTITYDANGGTMSPLHTINNLISESSFESVSKWSGAVVDNTVGYTGSSSLKLSGTTVASIPIDKPIAGHKYYGRQYFKASGAVNAADSRFEIFGGDGAGLNWVFGVNNSATTSWSMLSGVVTIDSVNASSYVIRTFVVNAQSTVWVDDMMLIDLTAIFGAGNEPSKEWCDANLNYKDGSQSISFRPYAIEDSVTLAAAPTKTGYTFAGWKLATATGNWSATTYNASQAIGTGKYGNVTLTAQWTPNSYYLDLNGYLDGVSGGNISGFGTCDVYVNGSLVADDVSDYWTAWPYGSTYEIKDIKTAAGRTYNGVYSGNLSGTITDATGVFLNFSTNSYKITYDENGGSSVSDQNYTINSSVSLSAAPTRAGYTFKGWKLATATGNWSAGTYSAGQAIGTGMYGNITLVAEWTPNTYYVTYDANGGTGAPDKQAFTFGADEKLSTTVPTRTGYTFVKWVSNPNNQDFAPGDTIPNGWGSFTLVAQWEANDYKVYYNDGFNLFTGTENKGSTTADRMSYSVSNGVVTVKANYDDGYGFIPYRVYLTAGKTYTFTYDATCTSGGTEAFLMLDGGYTTYYYMGTGTTFTPTVSGTYWLRLDVNTNGATGVFSNISIVEGSVDKNISGYTATSSHVYGAAKSLTANGFARAGYTFKGWNTKADGTGTSYADKASVQNLVSADGGSITLYAQWTPITYDITYNSGFGLPAGYKILSYIESTGTQYIDTGYAAPNGFITKILHSWTQTSPSGYIIGSHNINSPYGRNGIGNNWQGYWELGTGDTCPAASTGPVAGNLYWVEASTIKGNSYMYVDGVRVITTSDSSTRCEGNLLLFSNQYSLYHGSAGACSIYAKLYAAKIYSPDGTLVRDFVPCISPSGEVGMYDLVGGKFYGNSGTGSFIASETYVNSYTTESPAVALPSPSRPGYTFDGWFTTSNFSGSKVTSVPKGSTGNKTFYAKWTAVNYTISYDENGGSSVSDQNYTIDTSVTLAVAPTRTGYTFKGWKLATASGNWIADTYGASQAIGTGKYGNVTLVAQWEANSYTIKYDGNGNTGGSTASSTHVYDVAKALTANGFTKTGYTFVGWNTKADGTGTSYADMASVKNLASVNGVTVTLYAMWTPISYTIKYDGNGNTGGSTASSTHVYDVAKALTANGYTKHGYTFVGWNTKADGTGTSYADKASAMNLSSTDGDIVTLYAQWDIVYLFIDYVGNGATSGDKWTEKINLKDSTTYSLSDNTNAFSRVEENANGDMIDFKFVGWEISGEFYDFASAISNQDLISEAKTVSGREYFVVTVNASWDEAPVIQAVDRWFSLDEAQNGEITYDELMKTAEVVDGDEGDTTDFENGEGTFTLSDYEDDEDTKNEFEKFTTSGSVTVTYVAVDNAGNEVEKMVNVHIIDKDQQVVGSVDTITQFTRYISRKYYKKKNGEFIDEADGGVNKNSVWRIFYDYEKLLTETFNNKQDAETGEWEKVYQTWVITKDQIAEVKAFVEEYGLGKTHNEDALTLFYKKFYLGEE